MIPLHETSSGITFAVKVHPRAKANGITGVLGDALKISLTTPPADGRANQACIDFISEQLHLPRSSVAILSGHHSRSKVIRVCGISSQRLLELLTAHLS